MLLPLLVAGAVAPAAATPVVDVAIEPDAPSVGAWPHGPAPGVSGTAQDIGQSFTVGVTGELVSLELQLGHEWAGIVDPLLVDVRPVDAEGVPLADDASFLALVAIPPSAVAQGAGIPTVWHTIVLPEPISVVAGQVLAVVLRSDDPARSWEPGFEFGYLWAGQEEIYDGGEGFFRISRPSGDAWNTGFPEDFSLRTYVEPVPAPPLSLVLGAALLALGFFSGRRAR